MTTTDEYLAFAHLLADEAGNVLRRHFRQSTPAESKEDGSPVTVADREAEAAMRVLIRQRYPEHGIFGEEWSRENINAPLQWVLDPIDGTRAFMAGYPTFTTLIALCENGVPVAGVIDQPYLKERWVGNTVMPHSLRHLPQDGGRPRNECGVTIATTSLTCFTAAQAAAFARATAGHTVVHGGDAYAYAMLCDGHLSAVIDAGFKPYDFCALAPVVQAAGGVITDWQGNPLTINSSGEVVAARDAEVHGQLLRALKHVL